MQASLARAYARYGEACTCTPPGGSEVSCRAIISFGAGEEEDGADDYGMVGIARVQVADMATIPAGTTLEANSVIYEITYGEPSACGTEWICEIGKR